MASRGSRTWPYGGGSEYRLAPNEDQARRLLAKAEETCLIVRSLKATTHLKAIDAES